MTENEGKMITDLAVSPVTLRQLWFKHEPRRADGGWWALSGFSIQATIAFDQFVRRAVIKNEAEALDFDSVSDFLEIGNKVSLTQVKRTLTRATLAGAVAEACQIVALCSPDFVKTLEFQIVCERDEIGMKPIDLTPNDVFGKEPHELDHLNLVLAQFQAEPVRVMSHPGLSLRRTLLAAGVSDPDRVAREALGTLFDAFDGRDRTRVELALWKVISDIKASARREHVVPGRLLAPDLFDSRSQNRRGIFTGARPRLSDLVGGKFLERTEILAPVIQAAESWLSSLEESFKTDDLRLPVFWLDGQAGNGKSVLTFQLLEALVARRSRLASVTELATHDELSAWLATAAPWDASTQQAEIGFLDDLGSQIDQTRFDSLVDAAFYRGTRYAGLITCGSVESATAFSKARRITLTCMRIRAPTQADFDALRHWAEGRLERQFDSTGVAGSSISEFMISLTLDKRQQLPRQIGLSANLRAAMAVNALGLLAPASLISDADVNAFVSERGGIDISLFSSSDGVQLAHAEAIWPLYVAALGVEDLDENWGIDLGKVLSVRLLDGEATLARMTLGALINSRLPKARLQRAGSKASDTSLLDASFRTFIRICSPAEGAPLFRLWLAAVDSRRLSLVEPAVFCEEGRKLLANVAIPSAVKSEIAEGFLQMGRSRTDTTFHAAAAHMRLAGPDPAAIKFSIRTLTRSYIGELAEVALEWLALNCSAREVGDVLARVVRADAPRRLARWGMDYVKRFMEDPASGPVLTALSALPRSKDFYILQDQWLARSVDFPRALGIYRDQLQGAHWRRYTKRAVTFLRSHADIPGSQELIVLLLKRHGMSSEVIGITRAWLDIHIGFGAATPVLEALVEIQPLNVEDLIRALRHVDQQGPGGSGLFATIAVVLQALSWNQRRFLRKGLSPSDIIFFDQACSWRIQLSDGRLQRVNERVRRSQD